MDIETMEFSKIKLDLDYLNEYGQVRIYFKGKGFNYYLKVMQERSGNWLPIAVMHAKNKKDCPFCRERYEGACEKFEPYEQKIKDILFKDKNVRIKLLLGGITKGSHS